MKALSFALAAAVALLVCPGTTRAANQIQDAEADKVAQCTFVKDVEGRSVFGERLKNQAVAKAKEDARSQASQAGATHVVWGKISSTDITTVAGKAYRCPN
ncbi:MAG TPA: hypothetical protein VH375_11095 [Rhodanobacteraceae bacterium]|jgi:hypothetical protein